MIDLDPEDDATAAPPAWTEPIPKAVPLAEFEPEIYLLSCCLTEPSKLRELDHIPKAAFTNPELAPIWAALRDGADPNDIGGFAKKTRVKIPRMVELRGLAGLGTGFVGWLRQFDEQWSERAFRELVGQMHKTANPDPELWSRRLAELVRKGPATEPKGFFQFEIPLSTDKSVLLGDRYLNRGDGMVLSCSSGMGKSSMARQMAACWALGKDFHGIRPNGRLKSLEIQAEDSEGDIGELAVSVAHSMKLTEAECREVNESVKIVTERVRRGPEFISELRRLVMKHKPDLVWINPLQSFLEGDITEARDLTEFLSGGLNAINADCSFGYVIVHHTTKPPKGKDKADFAWHEIMYDMAGGAVIINWARAIMSLRATDTRGQFNLVLAKRGTRAGVTREIETGAGVRDEIVTEIPLKWSSDLIELPGRQKRLRCIFWEKMDAVAAVESPRSGQSASWLTKQFNKYRPSFPVGKENAIGLDQIARSITTGGYGKIPVRELDELIDQLVEDGMLLRVSLHDARYYIR